MILLFYPGGLAVDVNLRNEILISHGQWHMNSKLSRKLSIPFWDKLCRHICWRTKRRQIQLVGGLEHVLFFHILGTIIQLVGGLEHVLFFHILGTIIPIDFHIFQRG